MIPTILLHITVVQDKNSLAERLARQSLPEGLSVMVETCCSIKDAQAKAAHILIFDSIAGEIEELRAEDFPNSIERICCIPASPSADVVKGLNHPENAFTDVLFLPLPDELLTFWFQRLLRSAYRQRMLETTQTYLDTLIDSVPDLIWFKDLRGSHLKVNNAFCKAVGKSKQQCEGRGHYYIWDLEPEDYAKGEYVCLETEEEVIRRRETCLFDEKVLSKSGVRQFKTYKSPLIDMYGRMFGTVGIASDVTDLRNMSRELEVILSSIPFAVMVADEEDSVVYFNESFCKYFSVERKTVEQMHYSDICRNVIGMPIEHLDGNEMIELTMEQEGSFRVLRALQQPVHDIFDNHFGYFFLCMDATTEYELRKNILHSANTDFLTSLYNRRYFYEKMFENHSQSGMPVSLAYFDLDDFKMVNDTYGHQTGDQALVAMANLLREAFDGELITRLGGDEFVVAHFGHCDPQLFVGRVERFIEWAGESFQKESGFSVLTVSAGIAIDNDGTTDVDTLISGADKALYAAKSLGKGKYMVCCGGQAE